MYFFVCILALFSCIYLLNPNDLYEEDYEEVNEVHKTSAYIAPNGTTFEGWLIQEKYEIFFVKNSFLAWQLSRITFCDFIGVNEIVRLRSREGPHCP